MRSAGKKLSLFTLMRSPAFTSFQSDLTNFLFLSTKHCLVFSSWSDLYLL